MILVGVVAAMTGAAFSVDSDVRHDVRKTRNKNLDEITYYGEKFGRPVYGSILSALLYTTGLVTANNDIKETGQMLLESMIVTGIFTKVLKVTMARGRPFTGDAYSDIDPFEFDFESSYNSFPSGHTSNAFTVATVLSQQIDNIYASVALYSMASLTAFQRIYSDVHWLSDTLLGAAIGTFVGLKIVKLHEKNHNDSGAFDMNIFPQITPRSYGVGFSIQF